MANKLIESINQIPAQSSNQVGTANVAGTRFADISNPYANLPRERTFWDKFLNWFGFRSGYDKAQEQYNLAGAEYNAQLEQLASEEQYNSPIEQASRMRAAGLNPDLTGVSGEPASEFDNQQQSPDVSVGTDINPLELASNLGSTFMSALSGTMAILKDFQSLKQMRLSNDSGDLSIANGMMDFLLKSNPIYNQYGSLEDGVLPVPFKDFESTFFRSSRNVKRFKKYRDLAADSLLQMTNDYKSFDDFYKSAESYAGTMAQPYMSGFWPGVSIHSLASAMKPLQDAIYEMNMAQYEAVKKAQKYESKKTDYQEQVLNGLDPALEASAITSEHKANIAESHARESIAPIKIDTAKIYGKMLSALKKLGDGGDIGAEILGMLLGSKFLGTDTFGPATKLYNGVKGVAGAITHKP